MKVLILLIEFITHGFLHCQLYTYYCFLISDIDVKILHEMQAQTIVLQKLADAVTDIAASIKFFVDGNIVSTVIINIIITVKTVLMIENIFSPTTLKLIGNMKNKL